MRIAIAAEDNTGLDSAVSHHFGRCPFFVIVEVDGKEVQQIHTIDNPYFAGHEPGMVPEFIHKQGAEVMISGGMGGKAIGFFQEYGIKPATGATGTVRTAVESFLGGSMTLAEPCRESVEHAHHDHDGGHEG
ncbi:MAG TPA: NifB/NifX family molybdenum-iron cluster-binding protein [Anaerolineales bacterium]|nr:NifB/NifX family molybdenum-iron cluster-binding protein [Anaerolineales bacterium]